ncbi:glycosyltransferase family 1 protein [Backusella circina FSU 941]|nr:glycosyltransferase family 1 protein [Backusella circina FSU 941]
MNISRYLLIIISLLFLKVSLGLDEDRLPLLETYLEPKSFLFVGGFGGSSHHNWVLTILDETINRGHNVTFLATDEGVRFGKPFPRIQTISFGPATEEENSYRYIDFIKLVDFVKERQVDVMLCDHFLDVCPDVARYLKKPFIVTMANEISKASAASHIYNHQSDVSDFTSEFLSIYDRFLIEFVKPFRVYLGTRKFWSDYRSIKRAMGIVPKSDITESWADSIKLVNNFYGITPPRRSDPLVEHVGIIIPKTYAPLNEDLTEFLGNHLRVIYIAFGQHARATLKANSLILASLLEVLESGETDGILWSTASPIEDFPQEVTTTSNTTYIVKNFFERKHPQIWFEKWVPQTAVLLHPSTQLFVSHGGLGSISESLYAGKRMALFPFFGDQPGNAKTMERANVGGVIRLDAGVSQNANMMKELLVDKTGVVGENVKRIQALVQIHARDGPRLGAAILEEVAFSSVDGKIPHRYEASRRMSFIKAHKIDIYVIFILVVSTSMAVAGYTIMRTISYIKLICTKRAKTKTA